VIDEIAYLARLDMNLRTVFHSARGMVPSERYEITWVSKTNLGRRSVTGKA